MTYLWLKAGHIIFMVFWLAGLFMLPRQMIYLHPASPGSDESALWAKRMGLLRKVILTPSLIVVWVLGLLLAMTIGAWDQGWFHAKLLCVVLMTISHMMLARYRRAFEADANTKSQKFYRIFNEVPTVLMIIVVFMVIAKPF